jgi:hypothetical protein
MSQTHGVVTLILLCQKKRDLLAHDQCLLDMIGILCIFLCQKICEISDEFLASNSLRNAKQFAVDSTYAMGTYKYLGFSSSQRVPPTVLWIQSTYI